MDPTKGVVDGFLQLLRRDGSESSFEDDAKARIQCLPRKNEDFQTCRLRDMLYGRLEANLAEAVEGAAASKELDFAYHHGSITLDNIEGVVQRLTASPAFGAVVDGARADLAQQADRQLNLSINATDINSRGNAAITDEGFLARHDLSSSDNEAEGMHAKRKVARRDDWVGLFDACGGSGGFSPRVDVEAALGQLAAGLGGGAGSTAVSVEALGLLAEAEPELFQFGNHWELFLAMARRALDSADPTVHAKAMTLHWVMYEKSIGMCAADLCESVLDHARRYFDATTHVLSASTCISHAATSGKDGGGGGEIGASPMVVGDSELVCAAREAKALHGMLTTIHEAFQHLPERRVWKIVGSFLSLFGDAAASNGQLDDGACTMSSATIDNRAFLSGESTTGGPDGVGTSFPMAGRGGLKRTLEPPCENSSSAPAVLLPAHFLAIAGPVDEWLPSWLRVLPTGRLVRAVNEAGLVSAMTRRCDLQGRVPFRPTRRCRPSCTDSAATAAAATGTALEGLPKRCLHHRLSVGGGGSSCAFGAAGAAPLGRALWLPVAELERALLMQSVTFLGIVAAHCRGVLRPCPHLDAEVAASGNGDLARIDEQQGRGSERDRSRESGVDLEVRQGEEVLGALVQCATTEPSRTESGTVSRVAWHSSTTRTSRCVRAVALDYVGQVARSTAGADATPFSLAAIDKLFSPLDADRHRLGRDVSRPRARDFSDEGGVAGSAGGGHRHRAVEESPAFLRALAEIARVLLSSRGALAGFFVTGRNGPEASPALLQIVRFAAELARSACSQRVADGLRFRSLSPDDLGRLAVDFACALVPIMRYPPTQREAGWTALRRCGVPDAMAALVARLGSAPQEEQRATQAGGQEEPQDRPTVPSGGDGGDDPGELNDGELNDGELNNGDGLRRRLLLSLVEWAQDLAGVNSLRRVGLAGCCASFLSRELAQRHLLPGTRDECADPRPLALAARLALCPEGLDALVGADGGIAQGVDEGLARLDELPTLAEMLQAHTASVMPHPHAMFVGGGDGDGRPGVEETGTVAGMELGSGSADLRCLDFVRRVCFSAFFGGSDSCCGTRRAKRWIGWAVSRLGVGIVGVDEAEWSLALEEEIEAPEDVRVAALQVAADLATDLSTAVSMEMRWSLSERLARQQAAAEESARSVATSDMETGDAVDGGGEGEGVLGTPGVIGLVALGRARLAVSLMCLGGPTEERQLRMRSLRGAEAAAGGCGRMSLENDSAMTFPVTGGLLQLSEAVELPADSMLGVDWWESAGRCASTVASSIADPESPQTTEAFALLRKAIVRKSPLFVERAAPQRAATAAAADFVDRGGGSYRVGVSEGDVAKPQAVMQRLCFSYARGLGLVDDDCRDTFEAGLDAAFVVAAAGAFSPAVLPCAGTSAPTCPLRPSTGDCDWFAAVAFLVSGMDRDGASEMLESMWTNIDEAIFVWPLAGQQYAAAVGQQTARSAAVVATYSPQSLPGDAEPDPSGGLEGHPSCGTDCSGMDHRGVDAGGIGDEASHPCGDAPVVAELSRGDPPLLLLAALVEHVLEEELPVLSAALRVSGWSAAPLAVRWMHQCMLGVVDWPGVVAYLVLALLRGYDYQVYFVVSLLRAAEPRVMEAVSKGLDLTGLLCRGTALEGFDLEASISYMEGLEKRHRARCLASTRSYLAAEGGSCTACVARFLR